MTLAEKIYLALIERSIADATGFHALTNPDAFTRQQAYQYLANIAKAAASELPTDAETPLVRNTSKVGGGGRPAQAPTHAITSTPVQREQTASEPAFSAPSEPDNVFPPPPALPMSPEEAKRAAWAGAAATSSGTPPVSLDVAERVRAHIAQFGHKGIARHALTAWAQGKLHINAAQMDNAIALLSEKHAVIEYVRDGYATRGGLPPRVYYITEYAPPEIRAAAALRSVRAAVLTNDVHPTGE